MVHGQSGQVPRLKRQSHRIPHNVARIPERLLFVGGPPGRGTDLIAAVFLVLERGLLRYSDKYSRVPFRHQRSCGGGEEAVNKRDPAKDTWLFWMDVAAFDSSNRLFPAEVRFGCSQGSKALTLSKEPIHGGVIAFDPIVAPFSVDVPDAVKMR